MTEEVHDSELGAHVLIDCQDDRLDLLIKACVHTALAAYAEGRQIELSMYMRDWHVKSISP